MPINRKATNMALNRRDFVQGGASGFVGAMLVPGSCADGEYRDPATEAHARYKALPRISLVNLSTPLEKCVRLRAAIPGAPNLYIKRDDCLGYLVGGNKLRKLEYVMAELRRQNATTVLTVGGTTSNHARVTAMVARRLGLKCHLILNGKETSNPTGNLRIDKLLGIDVHFVESRERRNPTMDEVALDLEKKGERVYKVPLGASNEVGSFGFVAALDEALQQEKELGVRFSAIVCSSSSGGTQAGLEVGKRLFGRPNLKIIGVSPDDSSDEVKGYVQKAANPMLALLGLPAIKEPAELTVDDTQVGAGYRIPTDQSKEAEQLFVREEGILLDPVYTAKAAAGLIKYCRTNQFRADDHVLFWHTGGLIALFE
jgi:D-cysteine desulfhydrase family pyridoxal phosphate-dependent enzyme